jgi:Abortive infection C-terminus
MSSMPAVVSQTRFSTQTIAALTEVVTGGSAGDSSPSIGHYRSGPKLERFFGGLNVELRIGNASRVPTVLGVLEHENKQPDAKATIIRVIEACADPRDYLDDEPKLTAVVDYMNKRLRFDGYELRKIGQVFKVVALATNTVAAAALKEKAKALDLDSVHNDFERALSEADSDPADAITAACSTVESVCKCILDEMGKPYPSNKDIKGLVGEVAKHLNLSPGRDDLPKEWEQDIRTILSGLFSVIGGIGSLRTHAGDAHGKGKNPVPADARIARLAIHAASTVSLFYIETWQRSAAKKPKP